MWAGIGRKGLTREIGCELCFEEKVLVSIAKGGDRASEPVMWLSENTRRGMNLIYFEH